MPVRCEENEIGHLRKPITNGTQVDADLAV